MSGTSTTQAAAASNLTTGSTTGTSTSRTCTVIPNLSYMYCGGGLRISAVGEIGGGVGQPPSGGEWNFTVTISSNQVARGQNILLVANLTNTGQNITIKGWVEPY